VGLSILVDLSELLPGPVFGGIPPTRWPLDVVESHDSPKVGIGKSAADDTTDVRVDVSGLDAVSA